MELKCSGLEKVLIRDFYLNYNIYPLLIPRKVSLRLIMDYTSESFEIE